MTKKGKRKKLTHDCLNKNGNISLELVNKRIAVLIHEDIITGGTNDNITSQLRELYEWKKNPKF